MTTMYDEFKELIASQFESTFCTLNACIERCPETSWNAPVANLAFCQVVFHVLFFSDLYLGPDEESLRRQKFHRENGGFFRDYEELEDRRQQLLYDRPSIKLYLQHCRDKASDVIAGETIETLRSPCGFSWKKLSRAELHLTNIRHIQHHSAQLSLRLRIDANIDIPWFSAGWKDV